MQKSQEPDGLPGEGALSPSTWRQVFDASPSAMLLVTAGGQIQLANLEVARLFGYSPEELLGQPVELLVPERFRSGHPEQRADWFAAPAARAMGAGRDLFGTSKDGTEVPVEIGLNPIQTDDGVFVLVAIADIRARKRTEVLLRDSLQEKETLLREVHHRVKNNMQVVSSLLNLQFADVQDERYVSLVAECQTRVRTMALIHEKLYATGNFASLDAPVYLHDLTRLLFRTYLPAGKRIRPVITVDPLQLDLQRAVPVGLILHELVSNALKHAFVARDEGSVEVRARRQPDGASAVEVVDNGCGLPADFDLAAARGLGFRMVRNLVKQLDGTLTVHAGPGTRIEITFPSGA